MNASDIPRVVEGTRSEQLDDELLLFLDEGARILALNPVASLVWWSCDGKRNLGEIEALLKEAYPNAEDRITSELRDTIVDMVGGGVLELVEGDL